MEEVGADGRRVSLCVGGRTLHLYAPTALETASAVGGAADGPGDAELHTWAVPWESGLFCQMASWDLNGVDVREQGSR